jgi:GT2 family glycosyltransferase
VARPRASIVICAYNPARWQWLETAVASAERQFGEPEILVVIDHEEALLEQARARWPQLTVMPNDSVRGLSGARNTGVGLARGEFVAFLDDDAEARDDWLFLLLDQFTDERVAAVGGGARPLWPAGSTGGFYPPELLWVVGCSHRGLPESMAEVRNVIGCSMAFRRRVLLDHGGFSPVIGRIGEVPRGCEETELCIRIRQADSSARIVLQPNALVDHHVTPDRLRWAYLVRRSYHEGISKATLSARLGAADSLSTERAYIASTLPRAVLRELAQAGRGGITRIAAMALSLAGASVGFLRGRLAARTAPVHAEILATTGSLRS